MTNLATVLEDIEKDSHIDETKLDFEILRIPSLHSKYLNLYTRQSIVLRQLQGEYEHLKLKRTHYYLGKAPDEEYVKEPHPIKVLKTDLDGYLAADVVLTKKALEFHEQKLVVESLEKFLNSLRQRGYDIRTSVDYMKFKVGA